MINKFQQAHDAQNDVYTNTKAGLFNNKGEIDDAKWKAAATERVDKLCRMMADITTEENIVSAPYVQAVDLFVSFFDDTILECATITGRRAEIEGKIVSLCEIALKKPNQENARNDKDEHVTAKLADCLQTMKSGAAPDEALSAKMAAAVLDDTNPLRLGFVAYEEFCKNHPQLADKNALEYVRAETKVRESLINGNHAEAFAAMEKLLTSPFNCAEKYLLAALNAFFHGFNNDAMHALDVGLEKFPNNKRLLSAKEAVEAATEA